MVVVGSVFSGAKALVFICKNPPDDVTLDVDMPGMDGLELTRLLRAHPATRTLPVLILTTEATDQRKQEGRAAGATGWLVKPFRPEQLLEVVRMILPGAKR
ncbi:response regulator [bacterium]|nr:MAG: response regulator [bacterium]